MPSIRILSPELAAKIRAGEVIERPAAVAKELIENAIDAGSRLIAIQVGASPERRIRVQDDGSGMSREDALLSIQRHATSKLEREEELAAIRTLGFRGEALASIAEVARVTLSTRAIGELTGTQIEILGGTLIGVSGVGRAAGTTITVEDLFFNTPARLRFLKSRDAEERALARVVWSYILTYPAIHWRFTANGREDTDLPPAGGVLERWRILHGRGAAEGAEPFDFEAEGLAVRGLLGAPEQARASRENQVIAVNGRVVFAPSVAAALRQGYGNLIPSDRHPMAVLLIEADPAAVDVNIHPTKREVRFRDEGRVFQATRLAVADAMKRYVPVSMSTSGIDTARPAGAPFAGITSFPLSTESAAPREGARLGYEPPRGEEGAGRAREGGSTSLRENLLETEIPIWQLHERYLLAPIRGGLVIVDQHAAHERVLYEEARARLFGEGGASQHLLFPRVLDLSTEELERLLQLEPQIRHLGYEVALFGEKQIAIRAVPASIPEESAVDALRSLLGGEEMERSGGEPAEERVAKSFACHAAVRSGQPLGPEERRALIDRLFATELPHGDPHGRPTYVRVSLEELDRRFGRR